MTGKRVQSSEALENAVAILARLVEAETHQLARAAGAGTETRVAQTIEIIAKAGRVVAALAQTLDKATPSAAPDTQEDEGMNDDHAEFDALPIERKRAEIHRILDRMLVERRTPVGGDDEQRDADAPEAALASVGAARAAAA